MEIVCGVNGTIGCVFPRLVANGGDGRRDAFHVSFDPVEEDVIEVVTRSVAIIHNTDQVALSAIGRVVDPEALRVVFGPDSERFAADVEVSFVYEDLEVTLDTDGDLWLEWV